MRPANERTPSRFLLPDILLVEDSPDDARLILEAMKQGELRPVSMRVADERGLGKALATGRWDVVICDYRLPGFDVLAAIQMVGASDPFLPVIVVTGSVDEEIAGQVFRAGARDLVLKSRLARLVPAVRREMVNSDERRRGRAVELALNASEARFHAVADGAAEAVLILDERGAIAYGNAAAHTMLRAPDGQLFGRAFLELVAPRHRAHVGSAVAGTTTPSSVVEIELLVLGEESVFGEATFGGFQHGLQRFRTVMVRDVTERRAMEARLRQAERMEAVGQLAGGIAHDFNNVLGVITSYATFVLDTFDGEDPRRDDIEQVIAAAHRAASITRRLLTFSQRRELRPEQISLNAVVSEVERMTRRFLGEHIEWQLALATENPQVFIDRGQLEQILLNLAINARDAMANGGRLTVTTERETVATAREVDTGSLEPGSYAVLALRDSGTGMDSETRRRVFEPFFTTKNAGSGTGLGLATVHTVVRHAGGHVSIETAVGEGTCFRVYLPLFNRASVPARAASSALRPTARAAASVFVVEDDDELRGVVATVLARAGYTVLSAQRPDVALSELRRLDGRIDLLFTDVVLPGMTGPQLADCVRAAWPEVGVLFSTGYFDSGNGVPHGAHVLEKPFTPSALIEAVEDSLHLRRIARAVE